LQAYYNYKQDDWVSKLGLAEFIYNNSIHIFISFILFKLLYSIDPELRFNIKDNILERGVLVAEKRIRLLGKKHKKLIITLRSAAELYKNYYNTKHKVFRFKLRNKIIITTKNLR
jgi:hypothetical protein